MWAIFIREGRNAQVDVAAAVGKKRFLVDVPSFRMLVRAVQLSQGLRRVVLYTGVLVSVELFPY